MRYDFLIKFLTLKLRQIYKKQRWKTFFIWVCYCRELQKLEELRKKLEEEVANVTKELEQLHVDFVSSEDS